jgi:uncharacterized protein YndB with AHSA1/START domain
VPATRNEPSAVPVGKELVLTRVFDAPRELVWKIWTDANHVAAWWGPNGFTTPRCDWEARPGAYIYVEMKAPDGTIYPMTGKFDEVVAPERLVFTSAVPDGKGGSLFEVHNTVTLTEQGGKTTQTLRARVVSKRPGADVYLAGMEQGWGQSLDRLAQYVADQRKDGSR